MKFYFLAIHLAVSTGLNPELLSQIEAKGGLKNFIESNAPLGALNLQKFTTIDGELFKIIRNEIVPSLD